MNNNNAEGLFRRPHCRYWWMRFYAHDPAKGKRVKVQRSTGQTSLRKAKAVRATALAAVASGKHHTQHVERVMFEDLERGLIADYRANGKRSADRAQQAFQHLARTFGGNRAIDITAGRLEAYLLARLDEGYSLATVHYELAVLKRAFRLAIRRGELTAPPVFPELKAVNNARTGFFTESDLVALLVELPEHLRGFVEFAYLTGWRKQEMLDLRWEHVDWQAQEVRLEVGTTKNRAGRVFPFADYPQLRAVLEQQRDYRDLWEAQTHQDVPWVFHRRGKRIKDFYASWRAACKRAGVEGKHLHDFRRTACRALRRAGVPEHTAMLLTGHKTPTIFRRYDIHGMDDLRAATAKLAAFTGDTESGRSVNRLTQRTR